MSSDGSVIAGRSSNFDGEEAFRWTESGGMQGLGVLGADVAGYRYSHAHAMSSDGSVIVGQSTNSDGVDHWTEAFRWTEDGGMQGLGVLGVFTDRFFSCCYRFSVAQFISADGSVIAGQSTNSDGTNDWTEAFRWTSTGGMQGLGVLGVITSGASHSSVAMMTADGSVIVGTSTNSDGVFGWQETFRWTVDGGMQGLGRLQ